MALQGTFQQLQRHHCHNDIIDEHNIIIINTISSCLSVWRFLTYSKYLLLAAYLYGDSLHMPNITSLSFATYLYGDSLYNSKYAQKVDARLFGLYYFSEKLSAPARRRFMIFQFFDICGTIRNNIIFSNKCSRSVWKVSGTTPDLLGTNSEPFLPKIVQ